MFVYTVQDIKEMISMAVSLLVFIGICITVAISVWKDKRGK